MNKTTNKILYIVRHGETEFNRMNIVQGSGVDTGLNETGFIQATKFYNFYKEYSFDKIYISSLKRTQQSVQQFIDSGISHQKLSGLNEISWGDMEGKPQTDEQKLVYLNVVNKWNNGELQEKVPNGESPLEMQHRQKISLNIIMENVHENKILICMHGRAMKSFLCLLLDIKLTEMESFFHSNLGLYVLNFDGKKFDLLKQNDTEHLKK